VKKRKKQLSPIEPDVLNTEFMYLALTDDFRRVARQAGFKTFQDIIDNRERAILKASAFGAVLESELFEYAEYHGFIHLLGLE
jgi:ssRNA-specific RNase YbeY (16S rRNA maturation enzyme)